jgi:PadR family transcriptional regulator PadR
MARNSELMPGTLDMLILKTLSRASLYGYGIALSFESTNAAIGRVLQDA